MNLGDGAQVDGESQLYCCSFLESHVAGFDKYPVCAEVFCAAKSAGTSWNQDEDHGSSFMPAVETSLHKNLAYHCCRVMRFPDYGTGSQDDYAANFVTCETLLNVTRKLCHAPTDERVKCQSRQLSTQPSEIFI